jgi:hypothetical protein
MLNLTSTGENMNKTMVITTALFFCLTAVSFAAQATGQGPLEKFYEQQSEKLETACQGELNQYCRTVTPGAARGLACIYAHNDKLSRRCEDALYSSADELQNAMDNLNKFLEACQNDIMSYCSQIVVGEGRVLACLEKNKDKVSAKCNQIRGLDLENLGRKNDSA